MTMPIIIWPLVALGLAQLIKFIIAGNKLELRWKNLFAYSGMPSGHSALVASLALTSALRFGWSSPYFAFAVILAIIVIRDAVGLRLYLGQHGRTLNILVKDLKEDELLDEHYPRLLERIGHTPAQVLAGLLLGALVSLLGHWFFS